LVRRHRRQDSCPGIGSDTEVLPGDESLGLLLDVPCGAIIFRMEV
jgi:hypothetical protein